MNLEKSKLIRKSTRKDPLDDNRKLMALARESSRRAVNDLLDAGIEVVYLDKGQLVKKGPNRKITIIDDRKSVENDFNLKEYLCQG